MDDCCFPNVSCEWVTKNYTQVFARGSVGQHLQSCSVCAELTKEYFGALAILAKDALQEFQCSVSGFEREISVQAEKSCVAGTIDASTAFLLENCHQLTDDAVRLYNLAPHNSLSALAWAQRAFLLCRAFESQRLVEKLAQFENQKKPPKVGKMQVPEGNGQCFGEETSPSMMLTKHLPFGTLTFNRELHAQIAAEIGSEKFVHALVLICDSPKHGVMSSILNLAVTCHAEQIYFYGLKASNIAIRAFCAANDIQLFVNQSSQG